MYSPTTRLLTILELLQSHPQMSGSEIAGRLEVDKRTVRRYIVMLQDMGIPIEAERGPYGAYRLRRGYKLPPLMFTDAEAVTLTLGLLAIREFHFPVDAAAVEGALAKTERVMPERLFLEARALQESITFRVPPSPSPSLNNVFLTRLSLAAQQCTQVLLRYRAFNGEETERDFDPYGILFYEGYWYTAGYCHLRQGLRSFRLDRTVAVEPRSQPFQRPAEFDIFAYVMSGLAASPGAYPVEVFLKTSLAHAQQVFSPGMGSLEETPGGVIFRRSATQMDWIANFLLSLDFPVQALQPPELRDLLRSMAARARRMVGEEP
jgi:predicted DNA-binding transcriptional regulator YafY